MGVGSLRKGDIAIKTGHRNVISQNVLKGNHMGSRLDSFDVHLCQLVDVIEDRGKLPGERVDLFFGQPQPRKPCDVKHLFAIYHGAEFMDAPAGVSGRSISSRGRRFARWPARG